MAKQIKTKQVFSKKERVQVLYESGVKKPSTIKRMISRKLKELSMKQKILSVGEFLHARFIDNYNNWQALYDSLIMFGSLFSSKIINNLFVSKIVGQFENYYADLSAYLTEPVLTYFAYNWGYDKYFRKSFKSYKEKTKTEQIVIPVLMSAIIDIICKMETLTYFELLI